MRKFLIGLFFLVLLFPCVSLARIGVGVGSGIIQVEDTLKAGMSYKLPSLTILNTGDEPSDYTVGLAYHRDQPELAPPEEWFNFSPEEFYLEPGKARTVEIKLNLPLKTPYGDYFAYLEGKPTKKNESGSMSIGIAAAAKLYFTIEPSSFLEPIYYKTVAFWTAWMPWTNILAAFLFTVLALLLFKRFFNFELKLKKNVEQQSEGEVENAQ